MKMMATTGVQLQGVGEMVPEIGIEPTRTEVRWILSPLRLPVPPLGHGENRITNRCSERGVRGGLFGENDFGQPPQVRILTKRVTQRQLCA
jgi:hypothetical protein